MTIRVDPDPYTFAMPLTEFVTPLKRQTLGGDVYQQLRELLMSGVLVPGEQVSLRSIAAALGVSVMPVRDAVNRLTAEQALEVTPNRALRVPVLTAAQFREITAIRINLEGLATERAAALLDEAGLAVVERWHADFAREMARTRPDGSRLIAFNKELHFAVYRSAGMPMLLQLIEALWLRIGPILNHDLRAGSRRVDEGAAVGHHERLVKALGRHDGTAARVALQKDIESAAQYILDSGALLAADAPKPASVTASASRQRAADKLRGAGA